MTEKRNGLVLSVGRLWVMTLPFRLGYRSRAPGFRPGVRNILAYEFRRLWHRLYERERFGYRARSLRAFLDRVRRVGRQSARQR
jgi:hypothetical protein